MARLITMLMLLAAVAGPFAAQDASRPARDGEHCGLCGTELEPTDEVILHRGRTLGVCAHCEGAFEADPARYLAALGPRAALWQESEEDQGPVTRFWFAFGVYVLAGLFSGALCAYVAVDRGQRPLAWFAWGLLGNVLAVAAALVLIRRRETDALPAGIPGGLRKVPATRAPERCRSCGRENHPSARACSGCGAALAPRVASEVTRFGGGGA